MAEDTSFAALQDALVSDEDDPTSESPISESVKITKFEVAGLFGRPIGHEIEFPLQNTNAVEPHLLILMGPNGCGKTTVLRI